MYHEQMGSGVTAVQAGKHEENDPNFPGTRINTASFLKAAKSFEFCPKSANFAVRQRINRESAVFEHKSFDFVRLRTKTKKCKKLAGN